MAVNYTITLTDTEKKCMDSVTTDIQAWIENSVKNRARKAQNVIVSGNTNYCNQKGIAIGVVSLHRESRHMKIKSYSQSLKVTLKVSTPYLK